MPSSDAQLDRGRAEGGSKCPGDSALYPSGSEHTERAVSFGKCSSSVPDLWMGWGVERIRAADIVHKEGRFWEKIAS